MSQQNDDRREPPTRRPYQAPRVLESAEFETLALTCGKDIRGGGSRRGGGQTCNGQRVSAS